MPELPCSDADSPSNFDHWRETVRNPARAASEGSRRVVTANGLAEAEYETAPLLGGQYAIRWSIAYNTGSMSGHASPWAAFESREQCVEQFLAEALRHFEMKVNADKLFASQQEARRQMIDLLRGGLFGFIEPDPKMRKG